MKLTNLFDLLGRFCVSNDISVVVAGVTLKFLKEKKIIFLDGCYIKLVICWSQDTYFTCVFSFFIVCSS